MADSFKPKFVDLVRNYSTTIGTGNFTLGPAANGYTGFAAALKAGDSFYYSAIGVDRPAEREVGRGTLLADGTIARDPVGGTKTDFTSGSKSIALIAAAEWFGTMQDAVALAGAAPSAAATRSALAAGQRQVPVLLAEAGREGLFTFDASDLSAKVAADPAQGLHVPPASDPSGASGAWVRKIGRLHPSHFGARMDGSDDAPALNAFLSVVGNEGWVGGCSMDGRFSIASGLMLDGGTFSDTSNIGIDFGSCYITALAPISRMVSIIDCSSGTFEGKLLFRGTGGTLDNIALWTCDVGLYLQNCSQTKIAHVAAYTFGYAGIEFDGASGATCDAMWLAKARGGRVGSGAPLAGRSVTANWSARADSGGNDSVVQYSQIHVDTLPAAYAQANSGAPNFTPTRQVGVEINGQLCRVQYMDPATGTLRIYPWIDGAATSGTLKYHYGGGVVLRGGDAQLINIDQVDFNGSSCAAEFSAAYGSKIGVLHGEGNGSLGRFGFQTSSAVNARCDMIYSEGNTFRLVNMSVGNYNISVGSQMGLDTSAKDYDAAATSSGLGNGVRNEPNSFIGFTLAADNGGHHFKTKLHPLGSQFETIDFVHPATHRGKRFYCPGAKIFVLKGAPADMKTRYGYDVAQISLVGSGTGGSLTGSITIRPPVGQTVNGGAASTDLVLAAGSFQGPVDIIIVQTTATDWLAYVNTAGLSSSPTAGIGYKTGAGGAVTQATSKTTTLTNSKVCGQFTTSSAALAAGALATFQVTNTNIAATDTILLNLQSGQTTNATYRYWVEKVNAGSFLATIENRSAGSLSEALVFNFAIQKAVAA